MLCFSFLSKAKIPKKAYLENLRCYCEVWLSLVERYVRDVEAAGSNPVTPTIMKQLLHKL